MDTRGTEQEGGKTEEKWMQTLSCSQSKNGLSTGHGLGHILDPLFYKALEHCSGNRAVWQRPSSQPSSHLPRLCRCVRWASTARNDPHLLRLPQV